jgi:hypothetical protein
MAKIKLSKSMTITQFEIGYWYANELKAFAKGVGILHSQRLRKDELEKMIVHFLRTGKVSEPVRRSTAKPRTGDLEKGIQLNLQVVNYSDTKPTKDFIDRETLKISSGLKFKSGARYRLNRWREEQIIAGKKIAYRDLVAQYLKLNQLKDSFKRVPVGRYINFIADYLSKEKSSIQVSKRLWLGIN